MKKFSIFNEIKKIAKEVDTIKETRSRQEIELQERRKLFAAEYKDAQEYIKKVDDSIQKTKQ